MNPRVSWLPFTDSRRVASVRLRTHGPMALLRARGWDVDLHTPGRAADVVVFQKAYSPEHLREAARLAERGVRVVADFCDNHLWSPGATGPAGERAVRMAELAVRAAVRVAASDALADAVAAVAGPVEVAHDVLLRPGAHPPRAVPRVGRRRRALRLLWFGTAGEGHSGGLRDLGALARRLSTSPGAVPVRLLVVSNSRVEYRRHVAGTLPSLYLPWSAAGFAAAAALSDVAVVPVGLDPFTCCKTSNRPATAFLHGLACAADAVPSYAELGPAVRVGDWEAALRACTDPDVRAEDVRLGREAVRRVYDPDRVADEWEAVLHRALEGRAA